MKRFMSSALAFVLALTCLAIPANAIDVEPQASYYISGHLVVISPGAGTGKVRINFDVTSSKPVTAIGVSKIVMYTGNGDYITTIWGSTSNGLIRTDGNTIVGSYTYSGTSGSRYYAVVTIFAQDAYGSDSQNIMTKTITAP